MAKEITSSTTSDILVVVPTFYNDLTDTRYELALDLCDQVVEQASKAMVKSSSFQLLVVDGSPPEQHAVISQEMTRRGTILDDSSANNKNIQCIRVVKQEAKGRKGAALRQGLQLAYQLVEAEQKQKSSSSVDGSSFPMICFQEPEKADMIRHWPAVAEFMQQELADVCVPTRSADSFVETYPMEQYHSENFANLHLNQLAERYASRAMDGWQQEQVDDNKKEEKQAEDTTTLNVEPFPKNLDWTMGPIALNASHAAVRHAYTQDYQGDLWDMQLVPFIRAWKKQRQPMSALAVVKIVASPPLDYRHPANMKEQEQGVPEWNEKRLFQLNFLFEHLKTAWEQE